MWEKIANWVTGKAADKIKDDRRAERSSPAPARPAARQSGVLQSSRPAAGGQPARMPVGGSTAQQQTYQAAQAQPRWGVPAPAQGILQTRQNEVAQENRRENMVELSKDYNRELTGGDDEGPVTVREMDWGEYRALTPRQRAAVDVNTELVAAVNADKADQSGTGVTGDYSKLVERLFGEDGGSETAAPRTVALLDKLNMRTKAPQDLDQYLGLQALVSEDDLGLLADDRIDATRQSVLGRFEQPTTPGGKSTQTSPLNQEPGMGQANIVRDPDRYKSVDARAENALLFSQAGQKRLSETLSVGQGLIGAVRAEGGLASKLFGNEGTSVGFDPVNPRDQVLQGIFDTMARRDADFAPEELNLAISDAARDFGLDDAQLNQFFETRLKSAEYGNTPIGAEPDVNYLTPQEFRSRYLTGGN